MKIRYQYIFPVVVLLVACGVAVALFNQQREQELWEKTDLFSFVPSTGYPLLLEINDWQGTVVEVRNNFLFATLFDGKKSSCRLVEKSLSAMREGKHRHGLAVIGWYEDESASTTSDIVWMKLKRGEDDQMFEALRKVFPAFSPVQDNVNGTEVLYYALPDNTFLACFFYRGVFCLSYNPTLVLRSLACMQGGHGVAANSSFDRTRKQKSEFASATAYFQTDIDAYLPVGSGEAFSRPDEWSAHELEFAKDRLSLSGYLKSAGWCNSFHPQKTSILFDPYSFSRRTILGMSLSSDTTRLSCLNALDSLLAQQAGNGINLAVLPSSDSIPVLNRLVAFHLKSPEVFIETLRLADNQVFAVDRFVSPAFPPACHFNDSVCGLVSGEYFYLASDEKCIRGYVDDLKRGDNIAALPGLSGIWEQTDDSCNLVMFGNTGEVAGKEKGSGLLPVLCDMKDTPSFFMVNISVEDSAQVYCSTILHRIKRK